MKKLAFLVNPISGRKGNQLGLNEVVTVFPESTFLCKVLYSSSKKHLEDLTQQCINDNVEIIIACGGDGTVNSVAKFLVGTEIKLGILPRGSGNGLASHLKLVNSLTELHKSITTSNYCRVDCGVVNGIYFFSNFALGYPADVIERYDQDLERGFLTYLKHSLISGFSTRKRSVLLENSARKRFCVLVSNSKYLGYHISLTPNAVIDNGCLELVYANSRRDLMFKMMSSIFFKVDHAQSMVETQIRGDTDCPVQIDGEPIKLQSPFNIKVNTKCLKVLF